MAAFQQGTIHFKKKTSGQLYCILKSVYMHTALKRDAAVLAEEEAKKLIELQEFLTLSNNQQLEYLRQLNAAAANFVFIPGPSDEPITVFRDEPVE